MKNKLSKKTIYIIGILSQIFIIASLITLEVMWGASVQRDLLRGIYCGFFLTIFLIAMFDLYVLNKRNTTLKTDGLFKFSRHPGYVCLFFLSLSYWFADFENFIPVFILQLILWSALISASLIQEIILIEKYDEYAKEYYSKTPRFLFF